MKCLQELRDWYRGMNLSVLQQDIRIIKKEINIYESLISAGNILKLSTGEFQRRENFLLQKYCYLIKLSTLLHERNKK